MWNVNHWRVLRTFVEGKIFKTPLHFLINEHVRKSSFAADFMTVIFDKIDFKGPEHTLGSSLVRIRQVHTNAFERCAERKETSTIRINSHYNVLKFLAYYVHVTKWLLDTKYEQNPNQTELNKVVRQKGTPYDTLWRLHKAACI